MKGSATQLGQSDPAGLAEPVLELREVTKAYPGEPPTQVLHGIDLTVRRGELLAIVGPSGSGKSTLLNLIGTLDRPTEGTVVVTGHDVSTLRDADLSALRAREIGFVFQQFFLLSGLSAIDNVADGLLYTGLALRERRARAEEALERVGLSHRLHHNPEKLSGGERQRVAVARALVGRPAVVLADEPTGNLDSRSGAEILAFMRQAVRELGQTIVMVTHDPVAASYADRVLFLADGQIVDEMSEPTPERVLDRLKSFGE